MLREKKNVYLFHPAIELYTKVLRIQDTWNTVVGK